MSWLETMITSGLAAAKCWYPSPRSSMTPVEPFSTTTSKRAAPPDTGGQVQH